MSKLFPKRGKLFPKGGKIFRERVVEVTTLPTRDQLVQEFRGRAAGVDALSRCLAAVETGTFTHPDGRSDELGDVRLNISQVALLSYLCMDCSTPLSLEVGFGMGSSATAILGTLALRRKRFEQLIFDPMGLGDGRGLIVADYLKHEFRKQFQWLRQPSEIGLAKVLAERGPRCAGLIFIDGGHWFENVITDFTLADRLCCKGGHIIFDDAWFPAVETVVNYITANRADYVVTHLPVENCSVVQKISHDGRKWDSITPFPVPDRHDWTSSQFGGSARQPIETPQFTSTSDLA